MAVVTIYRLAEECSRIINGGQIPVAGGVGIGELKISIGQVANSLLRADYFQVNAKWGEMIPNGSMLGYYPDLVVSKWKDRSRVQLPIKPIKLPRDMGVYSVFPSGQPDQEFIPLQMGEWSLLRSQPLVNNILGQVGRETLGDYVYFTKDITIPGETVTVDMRLVILDIAQYDDYDPLPILPEMEWQIKNEVVRLYMGEPIPDKTVDASVNEQKNVPIKQQSQAS